MNLDKMIKYGKWHATCIRFREVVVVVYTETLA